MGATLVSPSGPPRASLSYLLAGVLFGALAASAAGWFLLAGSGPTDGVGDASGGGGAAGGGAPPGYGASPVDVVAAVRTIAAEPVQLLGTVAAVRESLVASEVDGLVAEVRIDEGATVREGDTLVRLRTADVEQELAAARAGREEIEARLARAAADFGRLEQLFERKVISRREYDEAVAERDALTQSVARLEAQALRLADLLDRATILAPFAGRVTEVHVELGEWVGRGDAIVALVDLSEIEVGVQIAERYISAVEPGFLVDVRFDALPGREYQGRVKAVVPQALPESRTFPVLVRVRNGDLSIKGGMAARVVAQLGDPEPAVLVSKDAIVRRGDQVLVFRVAAGGQAGPGGAGEGSQGSIEQISVDVGPARGEWRVVYGPIESGDLLVVRGNERVFPGQPVVIASVREPAVPEANPDRPIALDPRARRP